MPAMEFISDPGPNTHELWLMDWQRIDIAKALAGPRTLTRDGYKVMGRVVWGVSHLPDDGVGTHTDGLGYEIHEDGSVHCSGGYQAVIEEGFITGFRKERTDAD